MAVTGEYPLVGCDTELREIGQLVLDAASPHPRGGIGFIDGESGTGKSRLLRTVEEEISRKLRESSSEAFRFASVTCSKIDQAVAYAPFTELLASLTRENKDRRKLLQHLVALIKEVAPDLLQFIPGTGPLLAAGAKGLAAIGERALEVTDSRLHQEDSLLPQYVEGLFALASQYAPLVLMIDDAQFIDPFSCRLLLKLARRIQDSSLVILLAHTTLDFRDDSPSAQALQACRADLVKRHEAELWHLRPISGADIQKHLDVRFQKPLEAPLLVEWLLDLTHGNPHFVTGYLSLLEKLGIIREERGRVILEGVIRRQGEEWILEGRLASLDRPSSVDEFLKETLRDLHEQDRNMLQLGAIQGSRFKSLLLAKMLPGEEPQVSDKLLQLVDQRRIVSFAAKDEWENARTSIFAFGSLLMHEVLYQQREPSLRLHDHQLVAEILEGYIAKGPHDPYKLMKELAYHCDVARGNRPWQAAQAYHQAAQLSFDRGLFMEVFHLCMRGLANLREAPEAPDVRAPLLAQLVLLAVASQEMRLLGPGIHAEHSDLLGLLTEGEQAAKRAGDLKTLAQLLYLRGRLLFVGADVPSALSVLRDALAVARKSGDPLTEVAVLSGLGTQLTKESLTEGARMLYEAREVYERKLAPKPPETRLSPGVERHFRRLQMLIGLVELDLSHFDEALSGLEGAVVGLRRLKMQDDLLAGLNYLAQSYVAIGAFEDAEEALVEAHKPFENDEEPNGWDGYNSGLRGKLYMEWGRFDKAGPLLVSGWEKSEQAANRDQMTIVRNFYAEFLMHPAASRNDFQKARQLLEGNLRDSLAWGFDRTMVMAQSLLSRLELVEGNVQRAFNYGRQAVSLMEKKGAMPAVRGEEIFFHHSRVARARGESSDAERYLSMAHAIVQEKAASLKDAEMRQRYLERIPLNRAIQRDIDQRSEGLGASST